MSAVARRIQYNTQVLPFINDVALEEETITPKLKYVDSDIKKSYGCSSFIDITANQVNDSWFRIDTEWGTANSNWETLTTLNVLFKFLTLIDFLLTFVTVYLLSEDTVL